MPNQSVRRMVVLLAAAVLLSGTGCRRPSAPSHQPLAGRITNDMRLAAMTSVHAHARWGKPASFPSGLSTIPLKDAIGILLADEDFRAPSRRRRAVAKLAAYRLEEFETEIRMLGADSEKIEATLEEETRTEHVDETPTPAEKETLIADLESATFPIVGCPWEKLRTWIFGDGPTMVALAQVSVTRAVDAVSRAIDPQSWDECSTLFPDTYLAKYSNGMVIGLPPKQVGTAYGPTTLFEHFRCANATCDFENILGVNNTWEPPPTAAPRRYRVSYWFDTGIQANGPIKGLELNSDGGELWGRDEGNGTTTVFMRKELKFSSDVATGATQGLFEVHQDEMAGELAEIACCNVPAP